MAETELSARSCQCPDRRSSTNVNRGTRRLGAGGVCACDMSEEEVVGFHTMHVRPIAATLGRCLSHDLADPQRQGAIGHGEEDRGWRSERGDATKGLVEIIAEGPCHRILGDRAPRLSLKSLILERQKIGRRSSQQQDNQDDQQDSAQAASDIRAAIVEATTAEQDEEDDNQHD